MTRDPHSSEHMVPGRWPHAMAGFLVGVVMFVMSTAGHGQDGEETMGSVQAGRDFALSLCADCHIVSADQMEPALLNVPSFWEVANTQGMTETWIRAFLVTPHENMPNYVLSQKEMDDVIAYILSLKE